MPIRLLSRIKILREDPVFERARLWSNLELKRIAKYIEGDILNVSGWADEDKFGNAYKEYFYNRKTYKISNHFGGPQQGIVRHIEDSLAIDLEKPLDNSLVDNFDCILCHTVLEHVFDIFHAVENLCKMTRDLIIVIVPFAQIIHTTQEYSDYWRFTPYALERIFNDLGLSVIYRSGVDIPGTSIYYFYVFSKRPKMHEGIKSLTYRLEDLAKGEDIYFFNRIKNYIKYIFFVKKTFKY